jgi:hypothetical protein
MKFIVSRHGKLIFICNLRFRMRNTTRQESRGSGGGSLIKDGYILVIIPP